jgi:hypothetical protein
MKEQTIVETMPATMYSKLASTKAYTGKKAIPASKYVSGKQYLVKSVRQQWREVTRSIECRENRIKLLQKELETLQTTKDALQEQYKMDLDCRIDKLIRERESL